MSEYIVSRDKLSNNIEELKKTANGVPIWAVVKGDGYVRTIGTGYGYCGGAGCG